MGLTAPFLSHLGSCPLIWEQLLSEICWCCFEQTIAQDGEIRWWHQPDTPLPALQRNPVESGQGTVLYSSGGTKGLLLDSRALLEIRWQQLFNNMEPDGSVIVCVCYLWMVVNALHGRKGRGQRERKGETECELLLFCASLGH